MRILMLLITMIAVALPLSGCGKKGDPEPPPGSEGNFPGKYPRR